MAQKPIFLGDFRLGETIEFPVDYYDGSWEPSYYDIIDNDTRAVVEVDAVMYGGALDMLKWVNFVVTSGMFTEGCLYTVRVKENADDVPTDGTNALLFIFRVAPEHRDSFLGVVDKDETFYFSVRASNLSSPTYNVVDNSDGTLISSGTALSGPSSGVYYGSIDTSSSDFVEGRTYSILVYASTAFIAHYSFTVISPLQENFTMVRSQLGENTVLDNFTYDQAGNITGLRVRSFETASDARNATSGTTDPEPGEVASWIVEQEHDVPRNVRTLHRCYLEYEA